MVNDKGADLPVLAGGSPYGGNGEGQYPSGPHVIEVILTSIINHRNWVIGTITCALLLGLLATFLATPEYSSTARIEVLPDSPVATSVEGERDRSQINELAFYNTQYSLLESRSLAQRVVRAGNLLSDQRFLSAFDLAPQDSELSSAERNELSEKAAKVLLDQLTVTPVRTSSLIDVSFATPVPALSAKLADLWVKQFSQAAIDRRFAASSDARVYLEGRIKTLRQNLEHSEKALINYGVRNGIVAFSSSVDSNGRTTNETIIGVNIKQTSQALTNARATRIAAEAELANTMTGNAQTNAPTIGALYQKRADASAKLAQLKAVFADDYPEVAALRAQVAKIDESIRSEVARASRGNREAYNAAVRQEKDLSKELERLNGEYNKQQRASIELTILQREVDSNRQLYEGLLQRYKEIGVAGVGTNNVSIVDQAKPADKASSPNLMVNLIGFLFAGMAIAAAIVFVLEKLDSSIRDPQAVALRFGLPLLGTIPELLDRPLAEAILDKKSFVYEAYFSMLTNLSFLTEHGAPRTVLLTSSRPKEGKSNSTVCLATVLAATGKSVILVDADTRNPSANRYLDVPNKLGLTHYLSGNDDLAAMIMSVPKFGFDLMTAGKTPPNAPELLGNGRFGVLVEALTRKYDHVLIDAPPMLGIADVPLIARHVEGVLFTIEANSTKNRVIATALARLRMSGARIFGALVTKVGSRNQAYGYGSGYGYGFTYGSDKSDGN